MFFDIGVTHGDCHAIVVTIVTIKIFTYFYLSIYIIHYIYR